MEAGGRVELLVRAAETKLQDEMLRGGVCRVMPGEECLRGGAFEGEFYDGTGRFFREAAPPMGAAQMNSQFENAVFRAIGPESGATGVFAFLEQENRPILDVVPGGQIDFCVQPLLNCFKRERAADEARDFGVSPEGQGEREIGVRPMTKTEARSF